MRLTILAVALLLVPAAQAADWPQFKLEEAHTGTLIPSDFASPKDLWWKSPTGGPIEGSPIVSGGRVFVGSTDGKLYAFDAVTGHELWNFDTKDPISTTPAVFGGILYFVTIGGKLFAIDAVSGKERVTTTKGPDPGPSRTSVTIHQGRLYVGTEAGSVVAYNLYTLTKDWEYFPSQDLTRVVDPVTGNLTCVPFASRPVRSAPTVYANTVFFGSDVHGMFAVDEFGLGGAEAGKSRMVWGGAKEPLCKDSPFLFKIPMLEDVIRGSPAIDALNGLVIVPGWDRTVRAFDLRTGSQKWSFLVQPIPGGPDTRVIASPAVVDGRVYFGALNGRFYALETIPDWPYVREAWNFTTLGPIWSSAAVSNGLVTFGSDDDRVYTLDAANGKVVWWTQTGDNVRSSPALWTQGTVDAPILGGMMFVGSADGFLYAFGGDKPPLPDLLIDDLSLPRRLVSGGTFNLTLTVRNWGDAIAPPTEAVVFKARDFRRGLGEPAAVLKVPQLLPGGNATIRQEFLVPRTEELIRVVLDPDHKVREYERENNEKETKTLRPERTRAAPNPAAVAAAQAAAAERAKQQEAASKKSTPGPDAMLLLGAFAVAAFVAQRSSPHSGESDQRTPRDRARQASPRRAGALWRSLQRRR